MNKFLDTANEFRDLIQFGLIFVFGYIWIQSNFVSAMDFSNVQKQELEDKIYSLVIKQETLKSSGKDLSPWEKAELERARKRLDSLTIKK